MIPTDLQDAVRTARRVDVPGHGRPRLLAPRPRPLCAWYLWRAARARDAAPNAGHLALAPW
ncbi:hypothetical protein [Corynebacterium sp. CNJ-954]|uniref:hypothetical protein n=1 Tax=Corynebacterium sp. CNJ-954 TaxID=1904962 RepID=UPI0021008752|nr:hypothetical protein [Corynebacterium sp. CNJ-954]